MEDKAYEYYKEITDNIYVQKFKNSCLSGLTKGEIFYGGGFNKEDNKYYGDSPEYNKYEVSGVLYDERINSFSRVEYSFGTLECAEEYFEQLIKVFPLSRVKIVKKCWQQLRCYS